METMNSKNRPTLGQRVLTFVLSLVLVVTSCPVMPMAYAGELDDVVSLEPLTEREAAPVAEEDAAQNPDTTTVDNAAGVDTDGEENPADEPGDDVASADQGIQVDEEPEAVAEAATAAEEKAISGTRKNEDDINIQQGVVAEATLIYDRPKDGSSNYTLTVNGTLKGQIRISGGAKVTINGTGTIDGTGKGAENDGSVIVVEGKNNNQSVLTFDGPTVTGGTGTTNGSHGKAGGGILVKADTKADASLILKGGDINRNTADTGGGIYIATNGSFAMEGGTVSNNTANTHEGGGIFYSGKSGSITGGSIINNETMTTGDWGGGGIFVNNSSTLTISSASITNNTAQGLGGGVAGCPHASVGIGDMTNGAAIYGNHASGTTRPDNLRLELLDAKSVKEGENNKVVAAGDFLFYGLEDPRWSGANSENPNKQTGIYVSAGTYAKDTLPERFAQDYYCTLASFISPVSNTGQVAWTGYYASLPSVPSKGNNKPHNSIDNPVNQSQMAHGPVEIKANQSYAVLNGSLGLTSTYAQDPIGADRKVTISGNSSSTHGGGVGCNGTVIFGEFKHAETVNDFNLSFQKKVVNSNNESVDIQPGEKFEFELLGEDGKSIATAMSDDSGKVTFVGLPGYMATGSGPTSKTVKYKLVENLTEKQVQAGYEAMDPKDVTVELETTAASYNKNTGESQIVMKVHTTTVKSVKIGGEEGVYTNNIMLAASIALGVKKEAPGLNDKEFSFSLTEVETPDLTKVENVGDLTLKPETKLDATVKGSDCAPFKANTPSKNIEYDAPGEHWYLIAENVDGADRTISWDTSRYLVKVKVTVTEGGRSLTAEVTEVHKAANDKSPFDKLEGFTGTDVTFTNIGATYGSFTLDFTKMVSFGDGEELFPPAEGEFKFKLIRETDNAVLATGATDSKGAVKLMEEKISGSEEKGWFTKLTELAYMEGGEKTFEGLYLHEFDRDGNPIGGVEPFPVTLEVSTEAVRNDEANEFFVKPTARFVIQDADGNDLKDNLVVNHLSASTDLTLSLNKQYVGNRHSTEDLESAFTFVLQEVDEDGSSVEGGVELTANNGKFDNDLAGVMFDPITYTSAGTHYYRVTEQASKPDLLIGRDTRIFEAVVTVVWKDGHRELEVSDIAWYVLKEDGAKEEVSNPTFVNHDDNIEPLTFSVRKAFQNNLGDNLSLKDEVFSFELFEGKEDAKPIATATSDKDGVVRFSLSGDRFVDKAELNTPREYIFWIAEKNDRKEGVEYVDGRHEVKLTVKVDVSSKDGVDTYTPQIDGLTICGQPVSATDPDDLFTFTNRLKLETSFTPEVSKRLTGAAAVGAEGDYSFQLQELDIPGDGSTVDLSKLVPGSVIKKNGYTDTAANGKFDGGPADQSASVKFNTEIKYDRPGVHWYAVTETSGDTEAVGADRSVLVLKVKVDKREDGKSLSANLAAAYHGEGIDKAGLTELELSDDTLPAFHNAAKEFDDFSFSVTKRLVNAAGTTLDLTDGETFSFNVYESETGSEPLNAEPVTNDAAGTVTFTLGSEPYVKELTEDGTVTRTFWVGEVAGNDSSYRYATERVPVKVELAVSIRRPSAVEPVAKTTYTTTATVKNADEAEVVNEFLAVGEWTPKATKVYEGSQAASFSFTLHEMATPGDLGSVNLKELAGEPLDTVTVNAVDFSDGKAPVSFPSVSVNNGDVCWYLLTEDAGSDPAVSYDRTVYAFRVTPTLNGREYATQVDIFSASSMDATELVPGPAAAVFVNHDNAYGPLAFSIEKVFENSLGDSLPQEVGEFSFELASEEGGEPIARAKNDSEGIVTFAIPDGRPYVGEVGTTSTHTFYVRELPGDRPEVTYDTAWHRVEVDVETVVSSNGNGSVTYCPAPVDVRLFGDADGGQESGAVVNRVDLSTGIVLRAAKSYHGDTAAAEGAFSFTLQGISAPEGDLSAVAPSSLVGSRAGDPVTAGPVTDDGTSPLTLSASNGAFEGRESEVVFPELSYDRDGSFWYLVTEDGGGDPCAFVVAVDVAKSDDGLGLTAAVSRVYYADSVGSMGLTELEGGMAAVGFVNTDSSGISLASYAVAAASGEPVEQKCLVDPKVHKVLEGRTLKAGEFSFQLVQSAPVEGGATSDEELYNANGAVISTAQNDVYGMVDFDKANNLAPEGVDPSCLLFTAPGTYRYVVVEDRDYSRDPSIVYSSERITFTVVVEELDGSLVATQQYYGRIVDGRNVPCSESTDPGFSAAATWHPTMTNRARGSDLMVRKTSALDRDKGLEGATYGLYRVNDVDGDELPGQADILLGESTSDVDGWILFSDVSLSEGALYYFKEVAAPAGHTVSEFRSSYFYLVPDASAEGGWGLAYTDVKGVADEASPVDVGQTVALSDAAPVSGDNADASADPVNEPGNLLYVYDRDGGVYDEATNVSFTKLDTRTHECVEGAELSIRLNGDRDHVVASWVSGQEPKDVVATLDVDTEYVLREDRAPEGYAVANDVVFTLDPYGKVTLLSGSENGNAELAEDGTIVLYDTMLDGEEIVVERRENVRYERGRTEYRREEGDGARRGAVVPVTGDFVSGALWYWIPAIVVAGAATVLAVRKRRS